MYQHHSPSYTQSKKKQILAALYLLLLLFLTNCSYRFSEDGKLIPYNVTRQVLTQDCCEGYLRTVKGCVRDFCKYFHCNEDPNSRCVMVQRCGHVFPIFVTDQGILSEKCTQPKVSVAHLCPSDACSADSACNAKGAVCLANSCGCSSTAGPYWQFENLEEAQC